VRVMVRVMVILVCVGRAADSESLEGKKISPDTMILAMISRLQCKRGRLLVFASLILAAEPVQV
jgi:hypothetical protein